MNFLNYFRFFVFVSLITSLVSAMPQQSIDELLPQKAIWDIDIDVGSPLRKDTPDLFSRLRIGKQWIQGNNVKSLGVAGGRYASMGLGGGMESEWLNISSGFWAQGKILSTEKERLVTGIGLGWSLFGIEALLPPMNTTKAMLIAKIRLPIGLLTQ